MTSRRKIVTWNTLRKKAAALRREGRPVAFTNGCFDILHYGHVSYLEKAARGRRALIVGLNSDRSIRAIKGPDRPVNEENERAGVLAALACVDYVVIFDQDTPYELIKAVRPDLLIKGADWKGRPVVGEDIVRAHGGRVELVDYLPGLSTTNIIAAVRKRCAR
ncbi:MAG: D-glycero-beta-D-manno-heptose 1-phosphate adenylyltransferase [Candidatus Omnitrophota bacterium]